jgi:hypothetical protein
VQVVEAALHVIALVAAEDGMEIEGQAPLSKLGPALKTARRAMNALLEAGKSLV